MFFRVTFADGSTKTLQAHNRAELVRAKRHVEFTSVSGIQEGPGYYPMDDEFGYSVVLHRWIYQGRIIEDEEEAQAIYERQCAKRNERVYLALRDTFARARTYGHRGGALLIDILTFAVKLDIDGYALVSALTSLCEQGRIVAREMPYQPPSYAISFIGHPGKAGGGHVQA